MIVNYRRALAVLWASLLSAGIGQADLVLDLQAVTPTSVTSGGTVDVQMILRDTDNSHFGPTAGLGGTSVGLLSGGGKLVESATTGATGNVTGISLGADFPFGTVNSMSALQTPGLASALSSISILPPPAPAGILTGIAHIATFTVEVTGAVGSTVTIDSDILGLAAGGVGTVDGNVLFGGPSIDPDVSSFGSVTLSVTAIPEPSSLLLAGVIAGGGFIAVRRRRNAQKA